MRQMLKVEWLPLNTDATDRQEKLARIAEACQCPLLESFDCGARFAVATNEKAATLLASLHSENFSIYQSTFEKKELVELFLNEKAETMGADVTEQPQAPGPEESQK